MPFIKSISGLRATLSDDCLNQEIVKIYARNFAVHVGGGTIIVGRDGRPSGEWIEYALAYELSKCGCNVQLLGIVPTPTVQLEVEHSDAAGGIAITASHNPTDWNGLKFINSSGVFLDADENKSFWALVDADSPVGSTQVGEISYIDDAIEKHISRISSIRFISENLEKIRSLKLKVAVDAVNASGSVAVPKLLEYFGCEVVTVFCDGTGNFPHEPEPLPKNLTMLAEAVKTHQCDLGVAVDPDADRLVLVDGLGNNVNEEMTLALAVDSVLSQYSDRQNIVVNLSTSRLSEDIAKLNNCEVFRSPVGEINVVKKMKAVQAVIGGEGSGGVILPVCHYGRDSLVGIALVLLLLADRNKQLYQIIREYPKYSMIKHKEPFSGDFESFKKNLNGLFPNAKTDFSDGLRFDFEDSWLQIRLSNTEPIVRIIAEALTEDLSNELIEKAKTANS